MNSCLASLLPGLKEKELISQHTTFKIGGPAQYFYSALTTADLIKAVKAARLCQIPYLVIGNGSNILVADQGLKGLVIKNQTQAITVLGPQHQSTPAIPISPRLRALNKDYDHHCKVLVKLDSGVSLPQAIYSLLNQGISGLEWFAGIPATIGGAVYINLHGGQQFFSDYLVEADILATDNQLKVVSPDYFKFAYDSSVLKTKKDIVLSATLSLFQGPTRRALKIATDWAAKKSHQPQQSAGCIFQNLSLKQQQQLGLPTPSIGYLMDKVLKLKGVKKGQAIISPQHAGFISNLGGAKASQVLELIQLMKQKAKQKLGLDLKLEIVLLGFDSRL